MLCKSEKLLDLCHCFSILVTDFEQVVPEIFILSISTARQTIVQSQQ